MRRATVLSVLFLLFIPAPFGAGAEPTAAPPKGIGEMTTAEVIGEAHRLYRDDVAYGESIRSILKHADDAWPALGEPERYRYANVYGEVVEALRLLRGVAQPQAPAAVRTSAAAMRISEAFGSLKLHEESRKFHREVFDSEYFQKSTSAYRDAVIDLWQRYEKAGLPVPYLDLMGLNQPAMGRPGGQNHFLDDWSIGNSYMEVGEPVAAAQWYEKVPPEGLGPLKAADAYFAAGHYDEAAKWYRHTADHLDEWAAKKARLKDQVVALPLLALDPVASRAHVQQRLAEIERLRKKDRTL